MTCDWTHYNVALIHSSDVTVAFFSCHMCPFTLYPTSGSAVVVGSGMSVSPAGCSPPWKQMLLLSKTNLYYYLYYYWANYKQLV